MPRINERLKKLNAKLIKEGFNKDKWLEENAIIEYKPKSKKSKSYEEGEIMKAKSELKKKGNKYSVDTEMNVKEGLEPKVKRALKKSVDKELDRNFKGGSINLDFDDSSSDDEKPKKPEKKVDINELKNYARMLAHLLEHIEDPKEPKDKKDYRDAKRLIDNMEKVKGKGIMGAGDMEHITSKEGVKKPVRRKGMSDDLKRASDEIRLNALEDSRKAQNLLQIDNLNKVKYKYMGESKKLDNLIDGTIDLIERTDGNFRGNDKDKFVSNINKIGKITQELNEGDETERKIERIKHLGVEAYRDPFREIEEAEKEQEGKGIKRKRGRPRKH